MTATTETPALFVWNNSYKDHEQVRPYMAGYLAVRAELDAAGQYPYNDSFVGRIDGLAGSANEDTGIYLLQTLHQLDTDAVTVAAFIAEGGTPITAAELGTRVIRGTVLHYGYYMGGTGISRHDDVRLLVSHGHLAVLPKGARTRGRLLTDGSVLIRKAV